MTKRTQANATKKRQRDEEIQRLEEIEEEEKKKLTSKKTKKVKVAAINANSNANVNSNSKETAVVSSSQCYPTGKLPSIINYHNFQVETLPSDWGLPAQATLAAQNIKSYARLMGCIELEFKDVDAATMKDLTKAVASVVPYRPNCFCNSDGEYPSPAGQIPLSRLLDLMQLKILKPFSSLTKELLHGLWSLQSPHTSPWNLPFIRVYSTHTHQINAGHSLLTISYHLYYSRLIFELISDPTIKFITEHLQNPPCPIIRCRNPYLHKKLHTFNKPDSEMLQIPEYRFSLQGLLKYIENSGYESKDYRQPDGLLVDLYDYQKSTCQWMLDHELDENGLNSHFWEEWQFPNDEKKSKSKSNSDSHSNSETQSQSQNNSNYLYYFPIGGEYRFTKPPVARGGLLCEEMGLGKTVEILALILSNPSPDRPKTFPTLPTSPPPPITPSSSSSSSTYQSLYSPPPLWCGSSSNSYSNHQPIPCHTSLIIVPNHLLPQWWNEITRRVKCGTNLENNEITAINLFQRGKKAAECVPICDIRGLQIIEEDNQLVYHRSEWGVFDHNRGNLVEIRNVPFATPNIILRGFIASHATYSRKRADDTSTTPTIYPCVEIQFEMTSDNFYQNDSDIHKFDIVLTSYSEIRDSRGSQNLYMSHKWHRIILDECQEIKNTTNQVATLCANLESERRWMVSGTPLCSKIEDLHGELNFLKIWPFCLDNSKDGFWELRIGKPFLKREECALKLLYALLDVVMMRHTKNQRNLLTNEPLIRMPSRTIEWRGVDLTGDDRFIYEYLESFAADAFEQFIENSRAESPHLWSKSNSGQLRSLYSLLSRCCTHTSAISLQNLDHLRRILVNTSIYAVGAMTTTNSETNEVIIPLLTPEEVLQRVQSIGSGVAGGLNRESNRIQASVTAHEADEKMRTALQERSLQSLNDEVVGLGLPQPISWNTLPYTASVDYRSTSLIIYPLPKVKKTKKSSKSTKSSTTEDELDEEEEKEKENHVEEGVELEKQSLALHSHFLRGDVGRVRWSDKDEAGFVVSRVIDRKSNPHEISSISSSISTFSSSIPTITTTVEPPTSKTTSRSSSRRPKKIEPVAEIETEMTSSSAVPQNDILGEIEIESAWTLEPQIRTSIFKKDVAKRKQPFIDLLVAHAHTLKTGDAKGKGVVQIHEGGFSTIYQLMAGQSVNCPLCLVEACRPTITTCVHVYCHDCIMDVVKRETGGSSSSSFPTYGSSFGSREAKCPCCRRGITYSSLMEVKMDNVEEIVVEQEEEEKKEKEVMRKDSSKSTSLLTISEEDEMNGDVGDGGDDIELQQLQIQNQKEKEQGNGSENGKRNGRPKRGSSRKKIHETEDDEDMEVINHSSSSSSSSSRSKAKATSNPLGLDDMTFVIPSFQQSGIAPLSTAVEEKFDKKPNGSMYRDPNFPSLSPTALPILRRGATYITPKIKALLEDMDNVKKDDLFAKFVIFSQYKESIVAMQSILTSRGIKCAALLCSTSLDNQSSLRTFYQDPNCNVLLLTTGVAATGLTLTIAHILYMLEPCSNAAEEAQAVSRIHRIGQTKCVRCVIFYAKDTCEDRLLYLREKNKLLSEVLANERSNSTLLAMSEMGDNEDESTPSSSRSLKYLKNKQRKQEQEQKEQQSGGVFFVGNNLGFLFGSDEDRVKRRKAVELEEQRNADMRSHRTTTGTGSGSGSAFGFGFPSHSSSSTRPSYSTPPSSFPSSSSSYSSLPSCSSSSSSSPACSSSSSSTTTATSSSSSSTNSSTSNSHSSSFSLFPRTGVVASALNYGASAVSSFFSSTSSSSSSSPSNSNPSCSNGSRWETPIILDSDESD